MKTTVIFSHFCFWSLSGLFVDAGGMISFTNELKVDDSDTKGTATWGAISGTNLSGLVTSVITGDDEYILGGLEPRYYRIITGQNSTNENAEVTDYEKCLLDWYFTDGSGQVKSLHTAPPHCNRGGKHPVPFLHEIPAWF